MQLNLRHTNYEHLSEMLVLTQRQIRRVQNIIKFTAPGLNNSTVVRFRNNYLKELLFIKCQLLNEIDRRAELIPIEVILKKVEQ